MTLIDTGPLVAAAVSRERHHRWAQESFQSLRGPLTTCEAVLTEACFLLSRWPETVDELLRRVEVGQLRIQSLGDEMLAVRALMRRYRSVPMSYAGACLVRLTEQLPHAQVMTLDRDFELYRRNGRQPIPLLAPYRER